MRHLAANVLTIMVVLGIALVGTLLYVRALYEAPGPATEERVVVIPSGTGLHGIAEILEDEGVIAYPMIFRLGVRYRGVAAEMKAGEYAIPAGASMEEVASMLTEGRGIQHRITVAEGLTTFEVLEIVRGSEVLEGEITLEPGEGELAPETYFVNRGDSRDAVIRRMMEAQAAILAEAWEARQDGLPVTSPEEVLILASIVEKETGLASERPEVASVFANRLRRGMRLQSDPTTIYGITLGEYRLDRGLRRSELDARTPYNTYMIDGLPPTPIANPGRDAIMAVVDPADTDYLYFVADGTGGHAFARTLAEHNENVARWRAIEAERQGN